MEAHRATAAVVTTELRCRRPHARGNRAAGVVDDGEAGLVEVAAKRGEAVGVGGVDWPDEHGSSGNDRTHELTPLFDRAGFKLIEKGPIGGPRMIGVSSLRFVLMAAPPVDA